MVWLQGCPGVPNSTIGAHELLHALGAVPSGAPHACLGDDGHVCDSVDDLMYPTTTGQSLSQLFLDFNHDDYYGHPGSWDDIQDSLWLHRLNVPAEPLNVSLKGIGADQERPARRRLHRSLHDPVGSGRGSVAHRDPRAGQRFVRWSGLVHRRHLCALKLDQPATATALFGPLRIPLRVSVGRVAGRLPCTPKCTKTFGGGKPLTLRAVPARGWQFARWSGGCKGTNADVQAGDRLRGLRARDVQAALSQSRSSVGAEAARPSSSRRSSPTVLERSASTSWRWIVSRLTCCENRKSVSASSG